MNGLRDFLIPPRRIKPCRQHAGSQRYTDEQVCEHADEGRRGPDSRQRLAPRKPSHHDDIHRIEHQLQDSGQHQRQRKRDQFVHDRSAAHVDFIFTFLHFYFPPKGHKRPVSGNYYNSFCQKWQWAPLLEIFSHLLLTFLRLVI